MPITIPLNPPGLRDDANCRRARWLPRTTAVICTVVVLVCGLFLCRPVLRTSSDRDQAAK
jgi:hypothetical protein